MRGIENICTWSKNIKPNLKKSNIKDVANERLSPYIFIGK